jgi:Ca2+-transporting ATPase
MGGLVDPPRAEAKAAIARCHRAGIEVRMITGDHAVTAAAIAQELGITGEALTGAEFAALTDEEANRRMVALGIRAVAGVMLLDAFLGKRLGETRS